MAKRILIGLGFLIVSFGVLWLLQYLAIFEFLVPQNQRTSILSNSPFAEMSETITNQDQSSDSTTTNRQLSSVKLEVITQNLTVPWAIAFTDESRILITERSGAIREVKNGTLNPTPLISFSDVATEGEIGLMGMVLDPEYSTNKKLYVCLGYTKDGKLFDRVIALQDNGNSLTEIQTLLDPIPAGSNHAGCELAFGPDKKLYITAGDATTKAIAQDLQSLGGKILRINADGSIPSDNPFGSNSPIYSYGHRNPQGLDWSANGTLYEVEHGPSGNDGPGGGDELNLIEPGKNYGWPLVSHNNSKEGMVSPLITYTPAVAPASLIVYQGDSIPEFTDNLFFGLLRGEGIMRVIVSDNDPRQIISFEKIPGLNVGRIREIYQSNDGNIYFTTSNTDGRGSTKTGDDKLYKLLPVFK